MFYFIVSQFQRESSQSTFQLSQLLTGKIPGIPIMHHISKDKVGAF